MADPIVDVQAEAKKKETPLEKAARLRKEAEAAAKKKLEVAKARPGAIQAESEAALAELGASLEPGVAQIRRRGAEQLAAALGGARPTGLGARLAAARGLGKRGLTAEAEFRAEGAAKTAALRRETAARKAEAEAAIPDAELEFAEFEKQLATPEEDRTARVQDALSEVNKKLPEFDDLLTEDEEGAANMIRNVALRFRDIDPDLAKRLNDLADKIQDEDIELEDVGSITPAMLGL